MINELLQHIVGQVNTYLRNRAGDEDPSITKIILEDIVKQDLSTEGANAISGQIEWF